MKKDFSKEEMLTSLIYASIRSNWSEIVEACRDQGGKIENSDFPTSDLFQMWQIRRDKGQKELIERIISPDVDFILKLNEGRASGIGVVTPPLFNHYNREGHALITFSLERYKLNILIRLEKEQTEFGFLKVYSGVTEYTRFISPFEEELFPEFYKKFRLDMQREVKTPLSYFFVTCEDTADIIKLNANL